MNRGSTILFILVVILSVAAGVLLAFGDSANPNDAEFHRLVGGPATDLSPVVFAFDPRLAHGVGSGTIP